MKIPVHFQFFFHLFFLKKIKQYTDSMFLRVGTSLSQFSVNVNGSILMGLATQPKPCDLFLYFQFFFVGSFLRYYNQT